MKRLRILALGLTVIGCRDHRMIQPTLALPRPGAAVPSFAYPTPDGGNVNSSALGNLPTVLFLWSTHCPTSRLALTSYRELLREYAGRGVRIVMLSDDRSDSELALMPKVLADSGVRGELALAKGQLGRTFDHSSTAQERDTARVEFVLPAYLVLSSSGQVIERSWGPETSLIRVAVDSLLSAQRLTRVAADDTTGGR